MKGISVWCVTAALCWHACVSHTHAHYSAHTCTLALHMYEHWPAYILIHTHLYPPGSLARPTSVLQTPSLTRSTMTPMEGTLWRTSSVLPTATTSHAAALELKISPIARRRLQNRGRRGNIVHDSRELMTGTTECEATIFAIVKVPLQWRCPKDLETFCSKIRPLLALVIIFRAHLLNNII